MSPARRAIHIYIYIYYYMYIYIYDDEYSNDVIINMINHDDYNDAYTSSAAND